MLEDPELDCSSTAAPFSNLVRWKWWVVVGVNVFFLVAGQCVAVLLGRFYYDQGGKSKWLATLVQSAGFPILYVPLILMPSSPDLRAPSVSISRLGFIYLGLGILLAGDNMLYSIGLLYLSASTYSLVCASQLAFNAVFSFFINKQKFTFPILTSVIVLSFSAALIGVSEDTSKPAGVTKWKSFVGFVCSLVASGLFSLLLSLMQLTFQKVLRKETFSVVMEMQIWTSLVAACVSVVGLFASGEWKTLHGEMNSYGKGRVSYVMTLVWTALSWQMCSVGVVGLIFVVSSLFSNVVSTVALAVSPIAAVVVFRDKFDGSKAISMLLALHGFACYGYQNYLDSQRRTKRSSEAVSTAP